VLLPGSTPSPTRRSSDLQAAFDALEDSATTFGLVRRAIILPTLLFFGAWLGRVVSNVPALGGGIPGTSPWRAFVTTLVPGLNLRSEEHTSELQSPDHLVC